VGFTLPDGAAVDSFDMLPAMIGLQAEAESIRPHMLTQSFRGEFQFRQGDWKFLDHVGSGGNSYEKGNIAKYRLPETAPDAAGQLYNLASDAGETQNLYFEQSDRREQMASDLSKVTAADGRTAPTGRQPIGIGNIPMLK
jgi:hypothetical protein